MERKGSWKPAGPSSHYGGEGVWEPTQIVPNVEPEAEQDFGYVIDAATNNFNAEIAKELYFKAKCKGDHKATRVARQMIAKLQPTLESHQNRNHWLKRHIEKHGVKWKKLQYP
jgi:hypothetical protein